ncbi:MAG: acyltransferase family protein [Terriglobia bacterium]
MSTVTNRMVVQESGGSATPPVRTKERLLSLDVFRGMTLVMMTFVNNHGDEGFGYAPFRHGGWNRWTPTDLVFPFFIFIVGVAIPFSFAGRLDRGETKSKLYKHIISRAVILFAIGLLLNCFPEDGSPWFHFSTLRIFGILQRIGLCYLAASVIYLNLKTRGQAIITASLLVFYFIMMKFVPVPGYGAGVLAREGNWVQYIDIHVMRGHLASPDFETKGLLSTLPAIANALIGVMVGQYLRSSLPALEKIARFFVTGNVMMFLGLVWSVWFPINQGLWTSSLVLFMCGMALVIFTCCYYLVDIKKVTGWTKIFVIFGVNPIAIWVGEWMVHATLVKLTVHPANGAAVSVWTLIYSRVYASWAGPSHGAELMAFSVVLVWSAILAAMYKRRIFIKV